jgi:4-diphosphocytidyl-2-C-methyl-D-erythritol kinase
MRSVPMEAPPQPHTQVFAPAKINLFLETLGRRPDGFHEIRSLLAPISLGDRLELRRKDNEGIILRSSLPSLPTGEENLVVRAAKLWLGLRKDPGGIEIFLHKEIPLGAGLGGGSSDAAATLLGLERLAEEPLAREELWELAAAIGSDVPFFLLRKPALCEGRGERVTPVAWKEALFGILFYPGFSVSTAWAYQAFDACPKRGAPGARFFFGELRNDLEEPVFQKFLWLPAAKAWLLEQPEVQGALMSGSGSSLFALLREPGAAASLLKRWRELFGERTIARPFRVLEEAPLWPPPATAF